MTGFHDNGAPTDAQQSPQVAETAPATAPVEAPQAAPQAEGTPAPTEDHHAAVAALLPSEMERDNLAARIIASGGVAGVDLDVHGPDSDKLAPHVAGIQQQLQRTADEYVRSQGIDPEAFYQFVRFQGGQAMRAVGLAMYHSQGDAAYALTPLIHEFRRSSRGRR